MKDANVWVETGRASITPTRLKSEYGWTDRLIGQHLGVADRKMANPRGPNYPDIRTYRIRRVNQAIERCGTLHDELSRNIAKRRQARRENESRGNISAEQAVAIAERMEAQITGLPTADKDELMGMAGRRRDKFVRQEYGLKDFRTIVQNSEESEEQAVNMIRHEFSNYDELLLDMPKAPTPEGQKRVYDAIKRGVLHAIARAVPDLTEACRRTEARLNENRGHDEREV